MSFSAKLFKKLSSHLDNGGTNGPPPPPPPGVYPGYYPPPPQSPYPAPQFQTPPPTSPYQQYAAGQIPPSTSPYNLAPAMAPSHTYSSSSLSPPPTHLSPPLSPPATTASPRLSSSPANVAQNRYPPPPPLPSRELQFAQQSSAMVPGAPRPMQQYNAPPQQQPSAIVQPESYSPQSSLPISIPPPPHLKSSSAQTPSTGEAPRQKSERRQPPKVRKILSLDGGGVRGLSIITILKYIMGNLNRERGYNLEPWEEFDMIGGTSTGGIIAIMLGRLRMSLDECQAAYTLLSETIFTPVHNSVDPRRIYKFLNAEGKFQTAPLEDSIKSTIGSKKLQHDALLSDNDPDSCKVFVCATRGEDGSLAVLRSYQSRRHDPLYDICKIWEAARATSAASTFFEPIEIGPRRQKFVDGALTGSNNPVRTANVESRDLWPNADRLILSVGTGAAPGQDVTGDLLKLANRLKDIVTDSEQTNRSFRMENNDMIRNGRLFRFNVMLGLSDIGLEEHKAIGRIATYTDRYLDDPDIFDLVQSCVSNLSQGGQRMGYATAEEIEGLMRSMQLQNVYIAKCRICLQGLCFNDTAYYCVDCSIDVCTSCQPSHSGLHATSIVRFAFAAWPPQPDVAEATANCSECSLNVKGRFECSDCSSCLCLECSGYIERRKKWYEHRTQHQRIKGFIYITSPLEELVPSTSDQCDCLTVRGCISHCSRCERAIKIGESLHSCRTCRREYNFGTEICRECFLAVQPKHQGHEFGSILLQHVNEGTDDATSQFSSWWRCNYPGCNLVVGSTLEWMHRHPDARLCFGDALMDHYHKWIWRECPKTYHYRSGLRNPANPAEKMKCDYCDKSIAWDIWNQWCYTCDEFTCKTCVETGRAGHRHPLAWTRVIKKSTNTQLNINDKRNCDRCGTTYFASLFEGMECAICRDYHCCLACIQKAVRPQHPMCQGRQVAFDFWLIRN